MSGIHYSSLRERIEMSELNLKRMRHLLLISTSLLLISCGNSGSSSSSNNNNGGGGGGDGGGTTISSTHITGSVTLSSSVAGSNKPSALLKQSAANSLQYQATADQGVKVLNKPSLVTGSSPVTLMAVGDAVSNAYVYLYNAEHPEWLGPVAQDVTDTSGVYDFTVYGCTDRVASGSCSSDAATNDNAYVDGDPLPFGVYTMLIYKPSTFDPITGVTTDPIVSVLPAFKAESEELAVDNAEAEVSDATPGVVTMFGSKKNTDGTDTWGSTSTTLPANTAIQITFDMAMSRGSVQNIVVENSGQVSGSWSLSPDWKTATFTPNAALAAGVYTVTVPATTVNVYSNAMGYAATGTFTAIASDSTAPTVSVSSPSATTDVPATTPIRITSNEILKTNALRVNATPDIGDFPSMILVDSDGSSYVYEVVATKALQLGTAYNITISGIQDGAGNTAADLSVAFSVQGAAAADGVDDTATDATQAAQVAISEIFAKWVRAVNERNSAAIQSLMSGSFVFEYSLQVEDGFMDFDLNRNGRLSLKEFMKMIEAGMNNWEYCGTTVSGAINSAINVTSAESGNFEFSLSFASDNTSQQCKEDGPGNMYVTVKNINGLWKLTRMSEGYDHRGTTLASYNLIEANLYETASNAAGEQLVANGARLTNFADNSTPVTFKFDHVAGVESYVFLLVNERNPRELGFAFAISADRLACGSDTSCSAAEGDKLKLTVPDPFGTDGMPTGAYQVPEIFGFDKDRDWGIENPGEKFMWEIIGVNSYTALAMSNDTPSAVEFVRDINAVSAVKRFQNPGEVVNLTVGVEAASFGTDGICGTNDDVSQGTLEYNIYNDGYDAVNADCINVSLTIPDADGKLDNVVANFRANSNIGWGEYPVTFHHDANSNTSSAAANIMLFKGWTWVEIGNGSNHGQHFQVITTGGKGPEVSVASIEAFNSSDSSLGTLTLDQWSFVDASSDALGSSEGAVTLDVSWDISAGMTNSDGVGGNYDLADMINFLTSQNCNSSGMGWGNLHVHVGTNNGAYTQLSYCSEGGSSASAPTGAITISGNTISVSGLAVYQGDNWVSLDFRADNGNGNMYETHASFGIHTDTGSVFVAPVDLQAISTSEGTPNKIGDWGQGSDWDASAVTQATSEMTLTFTFANANSPKAHVGSDGLCCSDQALQFNASDSSYTLIVTLYQGNNWISIEDGNGSWYNVNIYTENGSEVPKPKFLTANGVDIPASADKFGPQQITVDQCLVTLTGTVPANTERLNLNWNGGNKEQGYWEGQDIIFPANTGQVQSWSATFQLVGGAGAHNHIDAWDEANRSGRGIDVLTSNANCAYTEPQMTVDGVRIGSASGTELVVNDHGAYSVSNTTPVTDTSAWVYGTSSLPGRAIFIKSHMCGQEMKFSGSASTTANGAGTYNWVVEVKVYDDNTATADMNTGPYPFNQWMDVSDGQNWQNLSLISDSNVVLEPAMSLATPANMTTQSSSTTTGAAAGCGRVMWAANPLTETATTIAGHTSNEDAWGGYGHANFASSFIDFQIDANGDFSFTVDLFHGFNHVWVGDDRGGYMDVEIYTENGNYPPQYLTVNGYAVVGGSSGELTTSSTSVSGNVVISGVLNTVNSEPFAPEWLNANVTICGSATCQDFNYDSMLQVQNDFARPMTYDPLNPQNGFSLPALNITTNVMVHVNVWGCSPKAGCHGHDFTFNDGNSDDNFFYKPGWTPANDKFFRHSH